MRSTFKSLISATAILLLLALCLHHVQSQAKDWVQNVALKGDSPSKALLRGPVSIPMETITGSREADNGYAWKYGYDVVIENGRLIVRVAVNLIPAGGTTQPELNRVKPLWEEGIERIWSNSFALEITSGQRYPMIVDVSFRGPHFHHDVIVRPGKGRTDELNWNILDSPELVAHEFGHMIGMYDEYEKGALAPENAVIDPDSIMASNPGEGAATHARHYEPFRKWFIGKTMMSNVRTVHEKTNHE